MKQKKFSIFTILLSLLIPFTVFSTNVKDKDSTLIQKKMFLKDNPVVSMLDSLSALKYFENSKTLNQTAKLNIYNFAPTFVPTYSDSIYAQRIAKLNSKSPFGLTYNQDVKGFIDLYAVKKRQMTQRILGLAQLYFPMFEEQLDKYKIPLELKYLAVVESALNPEAKSYCGATGLWQFMYSTGKMYNLNVTSYIDDRNDPMKATIAACRHFNDLYKIYKDWSLVLAAYNSGPGNVNKAIRRSGGEMDFWKIKKFLPKETQGYVPAFIAVTYVMNYPAEHNLYPTLPNILDFEIDTVMANKPLSFAQISEYLNIPIEEVEFLNPTYIKGFIPANADENMSIRLPKKHIADFINNETALYAYKTKEEIKKEELLAQKKIDIQELNAKKNKYKVKPTTDTLLANNTKVVSSNKEEKTIVAEKDNKSEGKNNNSTGVYIVKAGEGLGNIAYKNNCSMQDLQEWNNLKGNNIYPGQKLVVVEPKKEKQNQESLASNAKKDDNKTQQKSVKYVYHVVQKGDTLWKIASKYKGSSVDEIKRLNNLTSKSQLLPGQKIKVSVAG
ncbi:MAG: LysM peptidoglycan-binding domain-containing protein [Bacteroidetes bacterium]|nr:LysM peptidoglycan-binding domain-containing protein [Bacteroidota bacterium]